MGRRARAVVPMVAALAALGIAAPARAADPPVSETLQVPTVDGATLNVEIQRPATGRVPVILTYSPYNTLSESDSPNLANDSLGKRYVPKGYARAVADVLGTRNSSGCWDYGGLKEQQSGVDLVNFLARQSWSSGKVAMIGTSYDGTTANMVAARGADVPGLAAIVPEAAISRWYGYAYGDGVRYAGNSEEPSDEGIDTPLAFDFGLARTPPTRPSPQASQALVDRLSPCDAADHTAHGYDSTPDYDPFWLQRDYRKDAARFRAAVLLTHGWQDYNVKQSEGLDLFDKLPVDDPGTAAVEGVPFKRMFVWQAPHSSPIGLKNFDPLLDAFFDHTLKGVDNGVERGPMAISEGRTSEKSLPFRSDDQWPPDGTAPVALELGRGKDGGTLSERAPDPGKGTAYTDSGQGSEERAEQDPTGEQDFLFYQSPPLADEVRLAGGARLDAVLSVDQDHGHLVPTLVDVAPDGTTKTIARGFLNLLYRDGLAKQVPVPAGQRFSARVRFTPQDQTVVKGHRIGVIVESSNVAWAIADPPAGAEYTVWSGSSRVVLPVVGPPRRSGAGGPGSGATTLPFVTGTGGTGGAGPGGTGRRGRRLTVHIRRGKLRGRRVVVVYGRAPTGTRVRVRLRVGRRVVARRTVRARRNAYRVSFRVAPRARLRARVDARIGGARLHAISRPLRRR